MDLSALLKVRLLFSAFSFWIRSSECFPEVTGSYTEQSFFFFFKIPLISVVFGTKGKDRTNCSYFTCFLTALRTLSLCCERVLKSCMQSYKIRTMNRWAVEIKFYYAPVAPPFWEVIVSSLPGCAHPYLYSLPVGKGSKLFSYVSKYSWWKSMNKVSLISLNGVKTFPPCFDWFSSLWGYMHHSSSLKFCLSDNFESAQNRLTLEEFV